MNNLGTHYKFYINTLITCCVLLFTTITLSCAPFLEIVPYEESRLALGKVKSIKLLHGNTMNERVNPFFPTVETCQHFVILL